MAKALSIFLTLLMLISSTGITLGTHYCGGKAVKTAVLLGKGDVSCGMKDMDMPCSKPPGLAINHKGCCENQYDELQIKDNYKQAKAIDSKPIANFAAIFLISYFKLLPVIPTIGSKYLNYSPPLPKHGQQAMLMSFLI